MVSEVLTRPCWPRLGSRPWSSRTNQASFQTGCKGRCPPGLHASAQCCRLLPQSQSFSGFTSQASSEMPGCTGGAASDDFILVSKDEGHRARGAFSGQAQPLLTLKNTSGKSRVPAYSPLVFSDPLMGPASASSSNPSSSPDDDSSKDSGFTIVSPLDI